MGTLRDRFASTVELYACSDLDAERANGRAREFGVTKVCTTDELLADPAVDIVVVLTMPNVHPLLVAKACAAKKHVFVEKPLAFTRELGKAMVETARNAGLQLAGAADTFLGPGLQACRKVIDEGRIGTPVFAQGFIGMGGRRERYQKEFGGALYDMGPYFLGALVSLFGPVNRVGGSARFFIDELPGDPPYRLERPTTSVGTLDFACGRIGSMVASSDLYGYLPRLEIHGTEGTLVANDPNMYEGPVTIRRPKGVEEQIPLPFSFAKGRGLGVAEMAAAIREGRQARASGDLMYHVLDIICAIREASEQGRHIALTSTCERPAPFDIGQLAAQS